MDVLKFGCKNIKIFLGGGGGGSSTLIVRQAVVSNFEYLSDFMQMILVSMLML
jgi:hypothetical protein